MTTTVKSEQSSGKLIRIIASLYFWIELFGISAILFPLSALIFLFTAAFDKRLFILHKYTCLWSYIVLKINPMWRIKVTGREKIDSNETYIIVSNHQSGADIFVLFLLWTHFKWIAKKSLFAFPFIGWNMWLNRYIALERGKTGSMRKMMTEAAKALRDGNSVILFPEGTRSKDGNIQAFRTGAFHLAIENKVPILPIAIIGASKAIPKGGFLINKNFNIHAKVLEPIPYSTFSDMDSKELAAIVQEKIAAELKS
ncbi:MAG: lysophospholipid acyltransferase family protein [Bacteroidota bacterium]